MTRLGIGPTGQEPDGGHQRELDHGREPRRGGAGAEAFRDGRGEAERVAEEHRGPVVEEEARGNDTVPLA